MASSSLEDDLGLSGTTPPNAPSSSLESDLGIGGSSATPPPSRQGNSPEWDNMSLFQKNVAVAKAAPRWLMEGTGQLADTATDFIDSALSNDLGGSTAQGKKDEVGQHPVFQAIAKEVADRLNLPETPKSTAGRIIGAGVKAIPSAIVAGPESAAEAILPTAASGAASQTAAEAGAGPIGQAAAGLAPFAPSALAAGLRGAVRGGEGGAATMQQNLDTAQNAGVKISIGQVAENAPLRAMETVGSKIPGGGPLAETRGAGLNQQLDESVSNITKKLAPGYNLNPPTAMSAGEAVHEGVKNTVKGLKNETNEVADAMTAAVGGKDIPVAAPKLAASIPEAMESTGMPEVDKLIAGAKAKTFAKTAQEVESQPKVPTSYTNDGNGEHVVSSPNGETHFQETNDGNLKAWSSKTNKFDADGNPAEGKGESTARLEAGAQIATAKGGNLISDHSVSAGQAKAYEKLANRGWTVEKNPNAQVQENGNLLSERYGTPVYTVKAPKTETTPGTPAPTNANSGPGTEFSYDTKTGQSTPGQIQAPQNTGTPAQTKPVLNAATPWTFGGLKQFRTTIGKAIGKTKDPAQQVQLSTMYGAASDDLRAHAASKGPEAEQAWDLFNHVAKQNEATQKTLVRSVKALGGPEATFNAAMSGTKRGSTEIAPVMGSLDDEGKNLFRATVLHRLGRAGGAADQPFDANTFLNNYKGMSPEGKDTLFGSGANAGPPTQLRKSLDSISDTIDNLKSQGYIKSGFAKGVEQGTSGLHKLGIFGALAILAEGGGSTIMHAAAGHPMLAAGAAGASVGALAGNPVMSRVLTNPNLAAWLAQATKAPKGMVPVLMNQLNQMGNKDPDARDLAQLIQQSGSQ